MKYLITKGNCIEEVWQKVSNHVKIWGNLKQTHWKDSLQDFLVNLKVMKVRKDKKLFHKTKTKYL